jgi:hypothetical protein
MKLAATAAFLLLTLGVADAEAKTLTYPQENPQFSVTVPDDWHAEYVSGGIFSANPTDRALAVAIFPVVANAAPGAVDETRMEVEKRFADVQPGERVRFSNKQGIRFLERYLTGNDKGAARSMLIAAFTIDGKNYFCLFQVGTPAGTKRYGQDAAAVLKSIAPLGRRSSKDW